MRGLAPCCHTGMLLLSKGSTKQNCPNFGSSQHLGLTPVKTEAVRQWRPEFNSPLRNDELHYIYATFVQQPQEKSDFKEGLT